MRVALLAGELVTNCLRARAQLRGIGFRAVHGIDGTAPDPESECARHQALLDQAPIDLVVLGLGRDGHVAFDEPGSNVAAGVRRVRLHETTRADAAADFGGLEDAGRDTAENASRSLPIIRAIGDIRRIAVVTSSWHLRAPYSKVSKASGGAIGSSCSHGSIAPAGTSCACTRATTSRSRCEECLAPALPLDVKPVLRPGNTAVGIPPG